MKRVVRIKLEIDPCNYYQAEDSDNGAIELVIDCLKGDADFSCEAIVSCDSGEMRRVDLT